MVFVLLIAFHLSCSHLCMRPLGLIFIRLYSLSRYKGNHKSFAKFSDPFISGCDKWGWGEWNCPSEIQLHALQSWSGIISPISILNVLHNTSCCDFLTNRVFSESHSLVSYSTSVWQWTFFCNHEMGAQSWDNIAEDGLFRIWWQQVLWLLGMWC